MAKKSSKAAVGVGVGLTAAAVAAASAYFLYGSKNAPKNRKMVKSWMLKAKAEVLERLEQAKEMSEEEYGALIDSVAGVYGKMSGVSKSELDAFKKEMKGHWNRIKQSGRKMTKKVAKKAKKAVKRTKKTAKKVAKKSR
jgi:hypothetical protein